MFNGMTTSTTLSSTAVPPSFRRRAAGYHPADVDAAIADLTGRLAAAGRAAAKAVSAARLEAAARESYEDVLGLAHRLACAVVSDARKTAARIVAAAEAAPAAEPDEEATPPVPAAEGCDPAWPGSVDEEAFAPLPGVPTGPVAGMAGARRPRPRPGPGSVTRNPAARIVAAAVLLVVAASGCRYEGGTGPRAGLLGDSISFSADREIVAAVTGGGFRLVRASAPGRTTTEMTAVAERFVGVPPSVTVVEIGANDAVLGHSATRMRSDIRRLLGLLRRSGVACVRWTDLPTTGVRLNVAPRFAVDATRWNRVLSEELTAASPSFRRGAAVAGYADWLTARPGRRGADGLHLADSPPARAAFGRWIHQLTAGCR